MWYVPVHSAHCQARRAQCQGPNTLRSVCPKPGKCHAPEGDASVPELRDPHIEVDEECAQQAPKSACIEGEMKHGRWSGAEVRDAWLRAGGAQQRV